VKIQTKINKTKQNTKKSPPLLLPLPSCLPPKNLTKERAKKKVNGLRRNRTLLSTTYKEGNPRRRNAETMSPQQTQLRNTGTNSKANYSKC
jgi:hypothetical protein